MQKILVITKISKIIIRDFLKKNSLKLETFKDLVLKSILFVLNDLPYPKSSPKFPKFIIGF